MPDVAWFRLLATMKDHRGNPGCYILQPSGRVFAYALVGVMAEYEGAHANVDAAPTPSSLTATRTFSTWGLPDVAEGKDLVIAACGCHKNEANKIELPTKAGIKAPPCLICQPAPSIPTACSDLINQANGNIITPDDNYGGGLGHRRRFTESGDAFRQVRTSPASPSAAKTPEMLKCAADVCTSSSKRAGNLGVRD